MNTVDVIIIGAGCAGLTAGLYLGRAGLSPLIFTGNLEHRGGLLTKTSVVENYPGVSPDGIEGFDLIENMEKQASKFGSTFIEKEIISLQPVDGGYLLVDEDQKSYNCKAVVIATGSTPNRLGLEKEDFYWAKGLSSCAVCDGALYRNKKIVVVGGGDSAMEESLFLTRFSNVTLIHRRNEFRASAIMQKRVLEHPKIKIIYNTVIKELQGDGKLQRIVTLTDGTIENVLEVDGLFYALGLTPNSDLVKDLVPLENGYIQLPKDSEYETMVRPGLFVAGDVHDETYRQAVVAASSGCKAALDVERYLSTL
jgi:thioredoxin reductase (NADPH)